MIWVCATCATTNDDEAFTCAVCQSAKEGVPLVPAVDRERPPRASVPRVERPNDPRPAVVAPMPVVTESPSGRRGGGVVLVVAVAVVVAVVAGVGAFLVFSDDAAESARSGSGIDDRDAEGPIDVSDEGTDGVDDEAGGLVPVPTDAVEPPVVDTTAAPSTTRRIEEILTDGGGDTVAAPSSGWLVLFKSYAMTEPAGLQDAIVLRNDLRAVDEAIIVVDSSTIRGATPGYWVVLLPGQPTRSAAADQCARFGREVGGDCYFIDAATGER